MASKLWFQQARRRLLGRNSTDMDEMQNPNPAAKDASSTNPEQQEIPNPPHSHSQTRHELESTTDEQLLSLFFTRLPPELRRMIYAQVWRDVAGNGRMHLDTGGNADVPLRYVACIVGNAHTGNSSAPSPEAGMLWWAQDQLLALHWAAHAECARASRIRPLRDTNTSEVGIGKEPSGRGPFMSLFLTCKRMYTESITTLFETTTLAFQSSLEVTTFFTTPRDGLANRYLPTLRSVEINLAYEHDHVYLQSIANEEGHPRLPGASAVVVGTAAWDRLVRALAAAVPKLGSLDVFISGMPTSRKGMFADAFDAVGWRPERLRLKYPTDLQK